MLMICCPDGAIEIAMLLNVTVLVAVTTLLVKVPTRFSVGLDIVALIARTTNIKVVVECVNYLYLGYQLWREELCFLVHPTLEVRNLPNKLWAGLDMRHWKAEPSTYFLEG